MKTYRGGEHVERGIYFNLTSADIFQSPDEGARLPDARDRKYVRVPTQVALVAMPMLGLGYVVFLPVLGIAGLVIFLMHRLARLALPGGLEVGRTAVPAWVPGASYLVRGRREEAGESPATEEQPEDDPNRPMGELDEVDRELQERRSKGEK